MCEMLLGRYACLFVKLAVFFKQLLTHRVGFFESRRGCCGSGIVETSLFCNARSIGTCSNATGYVFWDGFHPTEAANQILAQNLLEQGLGLIS
ncbi:putative GDSL lipase/esterase, SGNH hydrolase superfamily [Helianthus anomalus]